MQTPNTTQHEQADAADRHEMEAQPRALSDLELALVVGGISVSEIVVTKPTDVASTHFYR
jgi:hypothetical protein